MHYVSYNYGFFVSINIINTYSKLLKIPNVLFTISVDLKETFSNESNRQLMFVRLLEQNRGIFSKTRVSFPHSGKEQAAKNISDMWLKVYAENITPKQVMKKFQNMKASLKYKLKMNGNISSLLNIWERRLVNLFEETVQDGESDS